MDWRNWVIGILVTWVSASFIIGRWSQKGELRLEVLTHRVDTLEANINALLGVRTDIASIRGALDVANRESSRVGGMIQSLIGNVHELKQLAVKLETWVCDLREGRTNGPSVDKRVG